MTNEEKAIEIAEMYNLEYEGKETSEAECYESAIEMAEWKDQQFKDLLVKWMNEGKIDVRNIDELLKEIDNEF